MWTCPKDWYDKIKGKGFTSMRSMTKEEYTLSEQEIRKIEREINCFVPSNAKASNIYRNRWALAYCCNMFLNSMMRGFFEDLGNPIDEDQWALGCLIQWMCRSRLRDGKLVELYMPSARMRGIYTEWLEGKWIPSS